jgi:hypothetical protein
MAVVTTLLRHGASPDQTDSNGWSSIQYGQMYPEIVQMFEETLRCKRPEVLVSHNTHLVVCRQKKRKELVASGQEKKDGWHGENGGHMQNNAKNAGNAKRRNKKKVHVELRSKRCFA